MLTLIYGLFNRKNLNRFNIMPYIERSKITKATFFIIKGIKMDLFNIRKQKLLLEIETSNRLKRLNIHPLDALDELIHGIIELRKAGLKKLYPNASEDELLNIIREEAKIYQISKRR